jgi:Putative  PD-(D/E)XK family member, (DUF4420)
MTQSTQIPSWSTVQGSLRSGAPKRFRLSRKTEVFLQVDASSGWLGLLLPWEEMETWPTSPLREIEFDKRTVDGGSFLAVGTHSEPLFHECFSFLLTLAAAIEKGARPLDALMLELEAWKTLLQAPIRMTREEEIGMIGELWTLHRLIGSVGPSVVEAWVAIDPESHDFRVGTVDIEVKTTVGNERHHTINDPAQVTPLDDHSLYILSIQIAPAGTGSGRTLPEAVTVIAESFGQNSSLRQVFNQGLERRGYREQDASHYQTRFKLRSKPALVPVDADFPAITRVDLAGLLGRERAIRVGRLQYAVKLDGLGVMDSSAQFLSILPADQAGDFL